MDLKGNSVMLFMQNDIQVGDSVALTNSVGTGYIRGGIVESVDEKFVKIKFICEKGKGKGFLVVPRESVVKDEYGNITVNMMELKEK
jgi:hypothetical protein